jgi:hypothetical protein
MNKKMKKIVYLLTILTAAGLSLFSCEDPGSVYEKYIIPNGIIYPQRADSLKIYPGLNSVRLTWHKAKDPKVVRARVYWNNYTDSLNVNIPADRDTIVADISGLDENTYTFHVITFDADGNASIPVEITGTPYGALYTARAIDRSITSVLRDDNYTGIITWGVKTSDLIYSEVRYTTSSGQETVKVLSGETVLNCPDIKPGELFEYRSVFLPPNGISIVEKEWTTYETPFFYQYPRSEWTAESRNGNHNWGAAGGQPHLVLDGDLSTGWHSNASSPLPQCLVVDMKESIPAHHLVLWGLPGNLASGWIYFRTIEVYLSDAPVIPDVYQSYWGEPAAVYEWPGDIDGFTIELNPDSRGRYLILYFPNSRSNTYISFAELEVYSL